MRLEQLKLWIHRVHPLHKLSHTHAHTTCQLACLSTLLHVPAFHRTLSCLPSPLKPPPLVLLRLKQSLAMWLSTWLSSTCFSTTHSHGRATRGNSGSCGELPSPSQLHYTCTASSLLSLSVSLPKFTCSSISPVCVAVQTFESQSKGLRSRTNQKKKEREKERVNKRRGKTLHTPHNPPLLFKQQSKSANALLVVPLLLHLPPRTHTHTSTYTRVCARHHQPTMSGWPDGHRGGPIRSGSLPRRREYVC